MPSKQLHKVTRTFYPDFKGKAVEEEGEISPRITPFSKRDPASTVQLRQQIMAYDSRVCLMTVSVRMSSAENQNIENHHSPELA